MLTIHYEEEKIYTYIYERYKGKNFGWIDTPFEEICYQWLIYNSK